MANIRFRFKRVEAAFNEVARARLCESSGSEHSVENSNDLSDLVDSFLERDDRVEGDEKEKKREKERNNSSESESFWSDSETKEVLQNLLGSDVSEGDNDVKRTIRAETELACRSIGNGSSETFKRRLMSQLRERGFDAGLCKSRWEKTGRYPSGNYEYIDVMVSGTRYVIEPSIAGQFVIARPTNRYLSLLDVFPSIFVGKQDELKQVVRLMCAAIKESMKSRDMHVPPWRRNWYMQVKWFGSYKRTTNGVPSVTASDSEEGLAGKRSVGFETSPAIYNYCRGEVRYNVGNLAAIFNGMHL
ncbi:hypothetical protein HHK36_003334 [Tetracentron sinense]|uniref:DUF506 family protein n=1 Tax=Tetracentron sinense TaxID=13715 RepID=A0A834ZY39_TETSI|nr:hypothetical protein HHK36_003334 [Tetracentron sinense]